MADPVTAGSLAVTALALAGEAIVKGAVSEMVKDAYAKLKALVSKRAPEETRLLEAQPSSSARRAVVVEVLDALPQAEIYEVIDPAQRLVDLLEVEATKHPIGIDVARLSAINVSLKTVRVESGVGMRLGDAVLQGDLTIDSLEVGTPPGKPPR
jgi:hypothetical protein